VETAILKNQCVARTGFNNNIKNVEKLLKNVKNKKATKIVERNYKIKERAGLTK